jgi:capsid portal protein
MAQIKGKKEPMVQLIPFRRNTPTPNTQIRAAVNMLGKALGGAPSKALGEADTLQAHYYVGGVVRPPFDFDVFADLAERTGIVAACIEHITDNVVGMGLEIVSKARPRGGSDPTEPRNGSGPSDGDPAQRALAARVFEEPNSKGVIPTDTLANMNTDLLSVGNGYLEITRDALGKIDGMHHLPARTMRVKADESGHITGYVQIVGQKTQHFRQFADHDSRFGVTQQIMATDSMTKKQRKIVEKGAPLVVKGYFESEDDAAKVLMKAERAVAVQELTEVIHFRNYSSRRGIYGVPATAAVFEDMVAIAAMKLWNSDFFENSTIPPALIIVSGGTMSQNLMEEIQGYMEAEGRQEYHRLAILATPDEEAKVDVKPLTEFAMKDSGWLDGMEKAQKNISMRYRVPFSQLTESSRRAPGQADTDAIRFREQVVRPKQRRIMGYLNGLVMADLGITDWEVKLMEGDLTEMTARAQAYERMMRRGAVSPDEGRSAVFDLKPMENGAGEQAFVIVPGVGAITLDTLLAMDEAQREALENGLLPPTNMSPGLASQGKPDIVAAGKDAAEKAGFDEDQIGRLVEALEDIQSDDLY